MENRVNIPTRTLLDLTDANTRKIVDDNTADTLIVDTSKPANPQYTYTVLAGNIPSNPAVKKVGVAITIGGQNTDSMNARTINALLTVNGVEKGTAKSVAINASEYWFFLAGEFLTNIKAGDVIGVKMWASAASQINYAYATLYFVPIVSGSQYSIAESIVPFNGGSGTFADIQGAIGGVTYVQAGLQTGGYFVYDTGVSDVVTVDASVLTNLAFSSAQSLILISDPSNTPDYGSGSMQIGTDAASSLYSLEVAKYLAELTLIT